LGSAGYGTLPRIEARVEGRLLVHHCYVHSVDGLENRTRLRRYGHHTESAKWSAPWTSRTTWHSRNGSPTGFGPGESCRRSESTYAESHRCRSRTEKGGSAILLRAKQLVG